MYKKQANSYNLIIKINNIYKNKARKSLYQPIKANMIYFGFQKTLIWSYSYAIKWVECGCYTFT